MQSMSYRIPPCRRDFLYGLGATLGTVALNALLRAVWARTGLAAGQLVVAFSHTHAAGLMGRERASLPGGELIPPSLFLDIAERSGLIQDIDRWVVHRAIDAHRGLVFLDSTASGTRFTIVLPSAPRAVRPEPQSSFSPKPVYS